MVVAKPVDIEIRFRDSCFHTLVIENKALFRQVINSFYIDTPEEFFVFSKHYEPFEFCKKGLYISNAINFEMNNRKLLTKINSYLEMLANEELYTELSSIKTVLMDLAENLISKSDFNVACNCEVSTKDIIKLFNFEITKGDLSFAEAFVRYIQLISQYLKISLFVVSDLHSVFDEKDLDMIFETLLLNEVNVLCIEGIAPNNVSKYEKVHIVDKDLCEIE